MSVLPTRRLSSRDRLLPLWILLAVAAGILLGFAVPGVDAALASITVFGMSAPIALCLLLMLYPVMAQVRYRQGAAILADRRLLFASVILNWVVAPAIMFGLAWIFLADLPEYRTGVIIVGLARCIAMVLVWNDLACGDREAGVVLVALNSLFQICAFGALGFFYLQVLPGWLGLETTSVSFSIAAITGSVLVFLGLPLIAGVVSRFIGERRRGREWYEERFIPRIAPLTLAGLLATIVLLCALQGPAILAAPGDVARIMVPLVLYFVLVFGLSLLTGRALGLGYARSTTLAFTAAGNNFELAIAVCIATFGASSPQALAGVVGPLVEVPILIGLVYVALWSQRFFPRPPSPLGAQS